MAEHGVTLGFTLGESPEEVKVYPSHMIVSGLTQKSGKTTTLEALINRSGLGAVVFKTKPGEGSFAGGHLIPAYLKERSDWEYVESLLEATMSERMRFERSWIIGVCKGAESLMEVHRNIQDKLADSKVQGLNRSVYTTLDAYFRKLLPEINSRPIANALTLEPGINIMDLEKFSDQLQSLVIGSVLETVLKSGRDTVVIMPEVWKFLPQERGNPVKKAAEAFIRQGAGNGNFLWFDSQDITGVDKRHLKQVSTWILGLQTEVNEVQRTLAQMPIPKKMRPKEDEIMTLGKGQFIVCTPEMVSKVYVWPAWMERETALAIARGDKDVATVQRPAALNLPALPAREAPRPRAEVDYDALRKELDELRRDMNMQLGQVLAWIHSTADHLRQEQPAVPVDYDAIVQKVLLKLPVPKPVSGVSNVLPEQIIEEVLKRIPVNGSKVYQVAPLEALQKSMQKDAHDAILAKIRELNDRQRRILRFLEAAQKGVNRTQLCEQALGLKAGGGNFETVKQISQELDSAGLARRDTVHGLLFPALRNLVGTQLSTLGVAEDKDVQEVYNHILHELGGGGGS